MEPTSWYPYGPPQGPAGPPAYGVRPPEDPARPLVVLGGRGLSAEEKEQVLLFLGPRTAAVNAAVIGLMVILLLYVFLSCFNRDYWTENLLLLLTSVLLFTAGFALVCLGRSRRRHQQAAWEEGRGDGAWAIEIYADRMASVAADRRLTIPFSAVRRAVETPAFFAVSDTAGRCIVIRAADLTPYDAQKVRETVFSRLREPQREVRGWILPALRQPLPIPVFSWETPAAVVAAEKARVCCRQGLREGLWFLLLLYSFALVLGVRLANAFWLTPNYVLDAFLFSLAAFVGILAVCGLAFAAVVAAARERMKQSGELPLYFGAAGDIILVGDRRYLERLPREDLLIRKTRRGWEMRVRMGKGSRWLADIPARDLPNPAVMDIFSRP